MLPSILAIDKVAIVCYKVRIVRYKLFSQNFSELSRNSEFVTCNYDSWNSDGIDEKVRIMIPLNLEEKKSELRTVKFSITF